MYATRVQIFLGMFAFKKRWMCVVTVTDGSTGYVVGFITRSIGKDIKIQENVATTKVPYIYIEGARKLPSTGVALLLSYYNDSRVQKF